MKLPPQRNEPVWSRLRQHDLVEMWDPSSAPHVAAAYRARLMLLRRLLEQRVPACGRVLDVGCAQGTLGLLLAESGYAVTLVDVRPEAIAYARERHERGDVEFVVGRLTSDRPARNDFDAVVCAEVLEHVVRPSELLTTLAAKVRPGGALVLTTPNGEYWFARLPTFAAATQSVIDSASPDSMDGDAHRFLYTREELVTLVRGVGLRVEAAGFFSPFWLEGHLKTRLLHRLLFAVRRRVVAWSAERVPWARRLCASQWLLACRSGGERQ